MNIKFHFFPDETGGGQEALHSQDGFQGLCDIDSCSFYVPCNPSYEEVKNKCDDHNKKNPNHFAAPVNCVYTG